jgi:hypothetical protein
VYASVLDVVRHGGSRCLGILRGQCLQYCCMTVHGCLNLLVEREGVGWYEELSSRLGDKVGEARAPRGGGDACVEP